MSRSFISSVVAVSLTAAAAANAAPIIIDISQTNSPGTRAAVAVADGSKSVTWNEIAGSGSIPNLVNTAGTATGVSFTFAAVGAFSGNGASRTNTETVFTSTTAASLFSLGMMQNALGKISGGAATTYTLSNLDPTKAYSFDFLSSLPLANGGTSSFTLVGNASTAANIASAGNTSLLSFSDVQPNSAGQINITWAYVSGTHAPLNVFQFEQVVPEPTSLTAIGLAGSALLRRRRSH